MTEEIDFYLDLTKEQMNDAITFRISFIKN